jgi:arylsulfatase A-like enzyme
MYPDTWRKDRSWYAAMTSYWDASLGNITDAIKTKPGMWNNTLLVFTTDNGGPAYWTGSVPAGEKGKGVEETGCHAGLDGDGSDACSTYRIPGGDGHPPTVGYNFGGGANNWPLRGSKISNFEGARPARVLEWIVVYLAYQMPFVFLV